jgi:2-phosphosulfolactate phosphatase
MPNLFIIDYLPESAAQYRKGWTVVAVDVIRATTMAVTAVAQGRRCFPVASLEDAGELSKDLEKPVMAGEERGEMPLGFDMNNSPASLARRLDVERPLVMISSSGTRLITDASASDELYLACFRNSAATARYLVSHPRARIALIGAGSRGEFREEDQICCAWIGQHLAANGYEAAEENTAYFCEKWRGAEASACLTSRSIDYLKRTSQMADLEFVLGHIDDLDAVCVVRHREVVLARTLESHHDEAAA